MYFYLSFGGGGNASTCSGGTSNFSNASNILSHSSVNYPKNIGSNKSKI